MTRRTITLLAAAALVAGALALTPTSAGGQTAGCDEPYSPVAFSGSSVSQPPAGEIPELDVTEVSSRIQVVPTFDTDGDGVDDTVTPETGVGVRITRGDGDVVLTTNGAAHPYRLGDLDGDGRDEIGVSVGSDSATSLVPGTVPTGTTALTDAGTALPNGTVGITYLADGTDRLLAHVEPTVSVTETRTDVFDASAVLALGPGTGVGAGPLAPEQTIPAPVTTIGDLGGPRLVLLGGRGFADPDEPNRRIELVVVDGRDVVELTTSPERYQGDYVEEFGPITLLDGPDGTFVLLSQSSRDGSARYLWSLDDPCTALVDDGTTTTTTSTTPTADPARPVPADAAFTG